MGNAYKLFLGVFWCKFQSSGNFLIKKMVALYLRECICKMMLEQTVEKHGGSIAQYTDEDWKRLAKQHDILFKIIETLQSRVNTTWKVATSGAFALVNALLTKQQRLIIKQGDVYFNLYCLLLGESGWIKKSSTRDFVLEILHELKRIRKIEYERELEEMEETDKHADYFTNILSSSSFTAEALEDELSLHPNSQVIADELSGFFKKLKRQYMEHVPEFLSELYDVKKEVVSLTRTRGKKIIKNAFFRMWGASTPFAFFENLEDEYFIQGFLPRFCIFYETNLNHIPQELGFEMPIYKEKMKHLIKLLNKIYKLKITEIYPRSKPTFFREFEQYCIDQKRKYREMQEHLIVPYYARLPILALKIAGMLQILDFLRLSEKDLNQGQMTTFILDEEFLRMGVEYAKMFEADYLRVIYEYKTHAPSVKHTTQERRIEHILNLLKQAEGVLTRTRLHRNSKIEKRAFNEILDTLLSMDYISQFVVSKDCLVHYGFLQSRADNYPFRGRPPLLIYHKEYLRMKYDVFDDEDLKKIALQIWFNEVKQNQ